MLNILTIGFHNDNFVIITKELFVYQLNQSKLNQRTNRLDLLNETPYPLIKAFSTLKTNDRFNLLFDNEQIHNTFLFTAPYLNKMANNNKAIDMASKIIIVPALTDAYSTIEYIIDSNSLEENPDSLTYLKPNPFYDEFYISNFDRFELVQWRNDFELARSFIAFAIINRRNLSVLNNYQMWHDLKRSFSPFYQVCIGNNQVTLIQDSKHFCDTSISTNISAGFMTHAYIYLFDLQYAYRIERKIIFTGQSSFIKTALADFFACPSRGKHTTNQCIFSHTISIYLSQDRYHYFSQITRPYKQFLFELFFLVLLCMSVTLLLLLIALIFAKCGFFIKFSNKMPKEF